MSDEPLRLILDDPGFRLTLEPKLEEMVGIFNSPSTGEAARDLLFYELGQDVVNTFLFIALLLLMDKHKAGEVKSIRQSYCDQLNAFRDELKSGL